MVEKEVYVSSQYVCVSNTSTSAAYYKTTANLNFTTQRSKLGALGCSPSRWCHCQIYQSLCHGIKSTYNGKTGYVTSAYLTKASAPTPSSSYYATTANLNLRLSAASWSTRLLTIPAGATVKYVSRYGSWTKVTYGSRTGYVLEPIFETDVCPDKYGKRWRWPDRRHRCRHGGNDPGAVYGSVQEKVIALDIAKTSIDSAHEYIRIQRAFNTDDRHVFVARTTRLVDEDISCQRLREPATPTRRQIAVITDMRCSFPTGESYTTNPYISASRSLGSSINQSIASRIPTIRNRGVKYQNVYVVGKKQCAFDARRIWIYQQQQRSVSFASTTYRQRMPKRRRRYPPLHAIKT